MTLREVWAQVENKAGGPQGLMVYWGKGAEAHSSEVGDPDPQVDFLSGGASLGINNKELEQESIKMVKNSLHFSETRGTGFLWEWKQVWCLACSPGVSILLEEASSSFKGSGLREGRARSVVAPGWPHLWAHRNTTGDVWGYSGEALKGFGVFSTTVTVVMLP